MVQSLATCPIFGIQYKPARKVLEAVANSQWALILGDPGSGKSSLLQYLALEWVESQTSEVLKTSEAGDGCLAAAWGILLQADDETLGMDWQGRSRWIP